MGRKRLLLPRIEKGRLDAAQETVLPGCLSLLGRAWTGATRSGHSLGAGSLTRSSGIGLTRATVDEFAVQNRALLVASGIAEKITHRLGRLLMMCLGSLSGLRLLRAGCKRSLPALRLLRARSLGHRTAVASLIRRGPVSLIAEGIRIRLPEKGLGVLRLGEGVGLIVLRALVTSRIRACARTGRVAILVLLLFVCWHFLAWLRTPGPSIVVYRFHMYMPAMSATDIR